MWYDEFSLRWGASLTQSINKGISGSRYGIVIFSPAFFKKNWAQKELNGLYQKMTATNRDILLPIRHNISHEELVSIAPMMADILNRSTEEGIDSLSNEILSIVGNDAGIDSFSVTPEIAESHENSKDHQESRKDKPTTGEFHATLKRSTVLAIAAVVVSSVVALFTYPVVIDSLTGVQNGSPPNDNEGNLSDEGSLTELDGSLPPGTEESTRSFRPTEHVIVLYDSGAQQLNFPPPVAPVKQVVTTVTTYVSGAVLVFDVGETTYSKDVIPNSNTVLTFPEPLDISNVRMSISGRGYPDDAAHVEYVYS